MLLTAAPPPAPPPQLSALVERHRFIRAVCRFHSASEEEIVFPALAAMRAGGAGGEAGPQQAASAAEQGKLAAVHQDHDEEGSKLEELGRLLGAVKAHARSARCMHQPPAAPLPAVLVCGAGLGPAWQLIRVLC